MFDSGSSALFKSTPQEDSKISPRRRAGGAPDAQILAGARCLHWWPLAELRASSLSRLRGKTWSRFRRSRKRSSFQLNDGLMVLTFQHDWPVGCGEEVGGSGEIMRNVKCLAVQLAKLLAARLIIAALAARRVYIKLVVFKLLFQVISIR